MSIRDDIEFITTRIDEAKQQKSEGEGAIKAYKQQLKTIHGLKTVAAAKKFIESENDAISAKRDEIEEKFSELRSRCGF